MQKLTKENTLQEKPKYRIGELLGKLTIEQKAIVMEKLKKAGIHASTISRFKSVKIGEKHEPNVSTLRKVADVLNVPMEQLFND